MPATFLELLTRSRAESVRSALQHWQGEAPPAWSAEDCQDAIRACLELVQDLQDLLKRSIREALSQPAAAVRALQERRQALEDLCDWVHGDLSALRTILLSPNHLTGSSGETARLDRAVEEVREARAYLLRHWPVRSPAEMAEDRRLMERGEGVEAEAAFPRIAGVDVETWRQRVEEHKRRKS